MKLIIGEINQKQNYKLGLNQVSLILPDTHIPFHHTQTIELAVREAKKRRINTIILNGDILDFYACSVFNKKPNKIFLKNEIDVGIEFFRWLRQEFPTAKIIWKLGNHEYRWETFINNVPQLFGLNNIDLKNLLQLNKFKIDIVGNRQIIETGKLWILHGDEVRGAGGKYLAKSMTRKFVEEFEDNNTSFLFSHFHRSDEYLEVDKFNNYHWSYATGCLCDLSPDYMPHNQWNLGYAIVTTNKQGDFVIENKRIIDGRVY